MIKSNWQVEHQCPQCGAPVILEETDRLFSCAFCRVRLYLVQEHFRYYLSPSDFPFEKTYFLPYWRFKGSFFSCQGYQIKHKVIDTSLLALKSRCLPGSLGLRTQALKLRFLSSQTKGHFVKPQIPFESIMSSVEKQSVAITTSSKKIPGFHRAFIGETLSMIYSPVFIEDKIYDAILNEPISSCPENGIEKSLPLDNKNDWQVKFISTLCPDCGWDLEGERDSLVLLCRNCHSAWGSSSKGFERLDFGAVPNEGEDVLYVPFWRINSHFEGLQVQSYADLVRIANLPKVIRKEWEEQDFYFWIPAFKVKPALFLRLAKQLTLSQPQKQFEERFFKAQYHPVTLPVKEGTESLKIHMANLAAAKKNIFPLLSQTNIKLKGTLLVYFPFVLSGNEFTHPSLRLSINKNVLRFGRYL